MNTPTTNTNENDLRRLVEDAAEELIEYMNVSTPSGVPAEPTLAQAACAMKLDLISARIAVRNAEAFNVAAIHALRLMRSLFDGNGAALVERYQDHLLVTMDAVDVALTKSKELTQ